MTHEQLLILISVLVPLALVAVGMILGWRALRRRAGDVTGLAPVPSDPGAPVFTEDLLYVATTRAEQPLQRIAVKGLGFRARAVLTVSASGVRLDLAGVKPGFIPAGAVQGVGRATWVIDRAVSHDGLVFVRWSQGPGASASPLDSYLRSADPDALVAAIESLIPTKAGAAA